MLRIDEGHKALEGIARTFGQLDLMDAGEAETRFHVIDQIVREVLGWENQDIQVETRTVGATGAQFADYVLSTASTRIVVEAKRVGAAFALPHKRRQLRLNGVLSEGEVGEAIRQARDYCVGLSIPFAVVTNGNSWIVFPAVRTDGVPFAEGQAHIFRSIEDIKERLVEFWELLSRERVMDGNLQQVMFGSTRSDSRARSIRQMLPEPGYRLGRNALYEHIEPAVAASLSDEALLSAPEALEACYVRTSERIKYDGRLRMHLMDSKPPLGQSATRVRSRKGVDALDSTLRAPAIPNVRRFIVVLGPVGAGKTTFLEHTRQVSARESVGKTALWLSVDFKRATSLDNPRRFMYETLLERIDTEADFQLGDWDNSIAPAYQDFTNTLRRGPLYHMSKERPDEFKVEIGRQIMADRERLEPYVDRILRWAATRWSTFLVVDNVDQIEQVQFQAAIFSETQAMAHRLGCNAIMCMREQTYLQHRHSPAFNAFQFDVMYVDAPSILPVLSHRLSYAKKVLTGRKSMLTTESGAVVAVPDLGKFFDIVLNSLLVEDAGFMFESLAGGDIRRGLSLVREFLASGHTNADRAFAAFLANGDYRFPLHEILRGAILGPYKYFNDAQSLIPNVFDAKLAGQPFLQVLRLRIVNALVEGAAEAIDGTSMGDLSQVAQRMGVAPSDFQALLHDLCARRLIHTRDGLTINEHSTLLPTRMAAYILRILCVQIPYNEFCSLDTEILDDETWAELSEMTKDVEATKDPVDRLIRRIERLRRFLDYVIRADERWVVEAKRRSLPPVWTSELVRPMLAALESEFGRAIDSAKRQRPVRSSSSRATSTDRVGGEFTSVWPDKDYAFIRDTEGREWFCHISDFADDASWTARQLRTKCTFLPGEWQGKPRAISVIVGRPAKSKPAKRRG